MSKQNPLGQLSKQYQNDRQRQAQRPANQLDDMAQEFMQQQGRFDPMLSQPGPSQHPELSMPGPSRDWAMEFNPQDIHVSHDFNEFNQVYQPPPNWQQEFQQEDIHIHPEMHAEFENAFAKAKESVQWEQEFAKDDWAEEFTKDEAKHPEEAIAKTAGLLLDAVSNSSNPKFKESKFLGLMQQFRDKQVVIEGDKVVQNLQPASLVHQPQMQTPLSQQMNEQMQQRPDMDPIKWAQEFGGQRIRQSDWEEDFNAQPSNWTNEFQRANLQHGQKWSPEYGQPEQKFEDDWERAFQEKMNLIPTQEQQDQWMNMEAAWKSGTNSTFSLSNLDSRFDNYEFTAENPYRNFPLAFLRDSRQHSNFTESILALEAALQQDPTQSGVWQELGRLQQDNENDVAAIPALKKALELNPDNLDALLYLSVSYTNERFYNEAYDSLQQWIERHPRYNVFAPRMERLTSIAERHEQISHSLMEAAVSSDELDELVQTALGVLFNISADYTKAVDCFEAAISKKPQDYQLWNKLGATLANKQDPHKAMDAYFSALQINPNYIRARFNLAIACVQIGEYREAAEHLLGALMVHENNRNQVMQKTQSPSGASIDQMHLGQSENVWSMLRVLLDVHIQRPDLVAAVDRRDMNAFRKDFDF
ncbi:hypothetical protein EDD86DRAFT_206808 [Gorgonomyces haynaldii]|nr:hypothetical protein EDD86DRAFT_206808 [Gorgonomyces haynaldii]